MLRPTTDLFVHSVTLDNLQYLIQMKWHVTHKSLFLKVDLASFFVVVQRMQMSRTRSSCNYVLHFSKVGTGTGVLF